jgi:hypothetical protein
LEKKKGQDGEYMKEELEAIKRQKQNELAKEIELLKLKEKDEMSMLEKETIIR